MPKPMALKKTAQRYAEMMENGNLLSNRNTIEIMDGRIMQLLERVDVDDAPDRVRNLYTLWEDLHAAQKRKDGNQVIVITAAMDAEFEKAYHDYAAWKQLFEIFDIRRKHVEGEVKIIKDMKAILTAEQARTLVAKLLGVCIRLIGDQKLLKKITYEFSRIIGEDRVRDDADVLDVEVDEDEEEDD